MIHCFNLYNRIETSLKCQFCFSETQKRQSEQIRIWTENDEEIKSLIDASPYCQQSIKENQPWCVYDYVKLAIMEKYGGWFMEADHLVETDMTKISVDKSFVKLYDNKWRIVTWAPIYVKKGEPLKYLMDRYDAEAVSPFCPNEGIVCAIPNGDFGNEAELHIRFGHFDRRTFSDHTKYGFNRIYFIDEQLNKVFVYYKDFYASNNNMVLSYLDFNSFFTIGEFEQFFSKELEPMAQKGKIILSDLFDAKLKKRGIMLNCQIEKNDKLIELYKNEKINTLI